MLSSDPGAVHAELLFWAVHFGLLLWDVRTELPFWDVHAELPFWAFSRATLLGCSRVAALLGRSRRAALPEVNNTIVSGEISNINQRLLTYCDTCQVWEWKQLREPHLRHINRYGGDVWKGRGGQVWRWLEWWWWWCRVGVDVWIRIVGDGWWWKGDGGEVEGLEVKRVGMMVYETIVIGVKEGSTCRAAHNLRSILKKSLSISYWYTIAAAVH